MARRRQHFRALLTHSHLLRACINLWADRDRQLRTTCSQLGLSPDMINENNLQDVELATARDIGTPWVNYLAVGAQEIMKYYFSPLQMGLVLFATIVHRYRELCDGDSQLCDNEFDDYLWQRSDFVDDLDKLRNTLLHDQPGKREEQIRITREYAVNELLMEGVTVFEEYLKRFHQRL